MVLFLRQRIDTEFGTYRENTMQLAQHSVHSWPAGLLNERVAAGHQRRNAFLLLRAAIAVALIVASSSAVSGDPIRSSDLRAGAIDVPAPEVE